MSLHEKQRPTWGFKPADLHSLPNRFRIGIFVIGREQVATVRRKNRKEDKIKINIAATLQCCISIRISIRENF